MKHSDPPNPEDVVKLNLLIKRLRVPEEEWPRYQTQPQLRILIDMYSKAKERMDAGDPDPLDAIRRSAQIHWDSVMNLTGGGTYG